MSAIVWPRYPFDPGLGNLDTFDDWLLHEPLDDRPSLPKHTLTAEEIATVKKLGLDAYWPNWDRLRGMLLRRANLPALETLAVATILEILAADETVPGDEGTPPADPFADLRQFARDNLKGQERRVIEVLCDAGGELPIADLAAKDGVGWSDEFEGFNNAKKRLNRKLKKIGWTVARQSNAAKLNRIEGSKEGSKRPLLDRD
jgi:hypothetical protein